MREILPADPVRRRLIYVVDSADFMKMDGKRLAAIEKSGEARVVELRALSEAPSVSLGRRILVDNDASAGQLLVQNPFRTDLYADAENAERRFILEKAEVFSNLCQLLGATSLMFKQCDTRTTAKQYEAGTKGGKKAVHAEVDVKFERDDILRSLTEIRSEFAGAKPDVDAARELLDQRNLRHDTSLLNLIEAVEMSENPLKQRTVNLQMNQEVNSRLRTASEITAIDTSLSARYGRTSKVLREINAEYVITF